MAKKEGNIIQLKESLSSFYEQNKDSNSEITKMNDDFLTVKANDTVLTIQRESVSNVLPKGTIKSI